MALYDCSRPYDRDNGIVAAVRAAQRGELVVLPTDTVYGVGCDAFTPEAVARLLAAKGRGRDMPVPVLVGSWSTIDGLVDSVAPAGRALVQAFWPGALTVVVRSAASLTWDLGDTGGTVALRMPLHPVALEVLAAVGPMAVSSANRTGSPPPVTAEQARHQLGDSVAVYLDAGPDGGAGGVPSSIVDVSGPGAPRLLRAGALDLATLREVVPELEAAPHP